MIEKCGANVRQRHPDGEECPCGRDAYCYGPVTTPSGAELTPLCQQHAKQVLAGVNVLDPDRPIVPRKVSA